MSIIKPNNNTISAITALPAAISTGKVLQVVEGTTYTSTSSTSSTYADTSLSASITPSSTSNKVLITLSHFVHCANANNYCGIKLLRGSTELAYIQDLVGYTGNTERDTVGITSTYLDTPSSTSALTYKTQFANITASGTVTLQADEGSGVERGRGSIVLMEIAG